MNIGFRRLALLGTLLLLLAGAYAGLAKQDLEAQSDKLTKAPAANVQFYEVGDQFLEQSWSSRACVWGTTVASTAVVAGNPLIAAYDGKKAEPELIARYRCTSWTRLLRWLGAAAALALFAALIFACAVWVRAGFRKSSNHA